MKNIYFFTCLLFSNYLLAKTIPFTIYHTNDLHSHFSGVKVRGNKVRGSFDRLSTAIKNLREEKNKKGEILIGVDAGDFFAGTVYSAIAPSLEKEFPEFEYLSENYFDVVTLGNHEFDSTQKGLEQMFLKAQNFHSKTNFVASNLYISNQNSSLKKFIGNKSLVKQSVIKEFSNGTDKMRVLFLGLLGPDACLVSKSTRGDVKFVGFHDDNSKADIKELTKYFNDLISNVKKTNNIDVVVISMHGGGQEAEEIVKKLEGVDVVIAGHTHEVERKIINGKIVSQTGDYGQNLGVMELNFDPDSKKVTLQNSQNKGLIAIDESIVSDQYWSGKIERYKTKSFELMGIKDVNINETVLVSSRDYVRESIIQNELGRMLSTRLLTEINQDGVEADFYFTSMGLIRSSILKDVAYDRADIFELVGIGYDKDLKPGVDTVTFYLTVSEVKKLINFLELYSHISNNFAPVFSNNLKFEINKMGIPFINRIKDIKLNGRSLELEENRLIKLATNRFVIDNLGTINSATHGLVKIDPKNKDGISIRNYPSHKKEYELLIESFLKHNN